MQEFRVCDSCKSLVRKIDSKCYSCGRLRAPDAKSIDAGASGAARPAQSAEAGGMLRLNRKVFAGS